MAQTQPTSQSESLPSTVDQMAAAVLLLFGAGEQRLITGSAELVRAAIANPALAPSLRGGLDRLAVDVATDVLSKVHTLADNVADTAARNGNAEAAREVRALERSVENWHASPVSDLLPHNVTASRLIAEDLSHRLSAAAGRITRFADDAYRAATTAGALAQINPALDVIHRTINSATPAEAQAQAWRELTAKGVTGFTDSAGREWNLATYVEMATRTATQRAYNASHRERLTLAGIHYFTISTTGRPCPLCAPWEGKVLADTTGTVTEPHAAGDGTVTFDVAATIEEAMAAGLFHPNCKHTLTAFLPGVTVLKPNQWTDRDEQAYRDTQKLRALEREVRKHRQVQAAAITDTQRAQAGRNVRAAQANVRAHTDQTVLNRRPRREQLNLGNK
jgi:hypothetical protein